MFNRKSETDGPMAKLTALVDEFDRLSAELADVKMKAATWREDRTKMLKSGNLNDEEFLKTLTFSSTKVEIADHKIKAVETRLEQIPGELKDEICVQRDYLSNQVNTLMASTRAEIIDTLKPWFSSQEYRAEIAIKSDKVHAFDLINSHLFGHFTRDGDQVVLAKELIADANAFASGKWVPRKQ